jgi:hypothetical protein
LRLVEGTFARPAPVIAGVYAPAMWILNNGWVLPLTFFRSDRRASVSGPRAWKSSGSEESPDAAVVLLLEAPTV